MNSELSLAEIQKTRDRLGDRVVTTPSLQWQGDELSRSIDDETTVYVKLELFQRNPFVKSVGLFNAAGPKHNFVFEFVQYSAISTVRNRPGLRPIGQT